MTDPALAPAPAFPGLPVISPRNPLAWLALALVVLILVLLTNRHRDSGDLMSLAKTKPQKPVAKKPPAKTWIGSAKGKLIVKPGVDLTKPTYALGP